MLLFFLNFLALVIIGMAVAIFIRLGSVERASKANLYGDFAKWASGAIEVTGDKTDVLGIEAIWAAACEASGFASNSQAQPFGIRRSEVTTALRLSINGMPRPSSTKIDGKYQTAWSGIRLA